VLSALVAAGRDRDQAYRLVQRNAARAWEEGKDFRACIEADPEVDLDAAALAEAFDLADALRHVDVLIERLGALRPRREEAVHA
jgi:adenylosuccinate lyase